MASKAVTRPPGSRALQNFYGLAMSALDARGQVFVESYYAGLSPSQAAKIAGYDVSQAQRILTSQKMTDAIVEMGRTLLRTKGPAINRAIDEMLGDKSHKDRLGVVRTLLERIDPATQQIEVKHEVVDHQADMLELLRHDIADGVPREVLLKRYGFSGLDRLERKLAEQAKPATVIEADFEEVKEDEGIVYSDSDDGDGA